LVDAHLGVEGDAFRQVADVFADLHGVVHHVEAADGGDAAGGGEERGEDPYGCGLAGPIGTEEADQLARRDLEVDVIDGQDGAVFLDEVVDPDRVFAHDQKSEVRGQRSEVRGQRSEVRGQRSE